MHGGALFYAVRLRDGNVEAVTKHYATKMWTMAIKEYLESKIQSDMPTGDLPNADMGEMVPSAAEAVGKPYRILALTSVNNALKYLCQYRNGTRKLATNIDTNLVVSFLQEYLETNDGNPTIPGVQSESLCPLLHPHCHGFYCNKCILS